MRFKAKYKFTSFSVLSADRFTKEKPYCENYPYIKYGEKYHYLDYNYYIPNFSEINSNNNKEFNLLLNIPSLGHNLEVYSYGQNGLSFLEAKFNIKNQGDINNYVGLINSFIIVIDKDIKNYFVSGPAEVELGNYFNYNNQITFIRENIDIYLKVKIYSEMLEYTFTDEKTVIFDRYLTPLFVKRF